MRKNITFGIIIFSLVFLCHSHLLSSKLGWKILQQDPSVRYRGLCVVDSRVIWASGTGGRYIRSVDGGTTWTPGNVAGAEQLDFRDVEAFDANTAILLSAGTPAKIYRTNDGGNRWNESYANQHPGIFFNGMDFWDHAHGIAISDPINGYFFIIRTEDGGKSWKTIPNMKIPRALPGEANFAGSGTCLTTTGTSSVWFGTGGPAARVFFSPDRGNTWSVYITPIIHGESSTGIFSVAFRDRNNGVVTGGDYQKIHLARQNAAITRDGGKTWILTESLPPSGFSECVRYFRFREKESLIVVSPSGWAIADSSGSTWPYYGEESFHSIDFTADGQTGWAVGDDGKIARFIFPVNQD